MPKIIRKKEERQNYLSYLKSKSASILSPELQAATTELMNALNDEQSALYLKLSNLSEYEKSQAIEAILLNENIDLLNQPITGLLEGKDIKPISMSELLAPQSIKSKEWLNPLTMLLINTLLSNESDIFSLHRILSVAMRNIPETTINNYTKSKLLKKITKQQKYQPIEKLSLFDAISTEYAEHPEYLEKSKSTGAISAKEFGVISKLQIDASEYIILALSMLRKVQHARLTYIREHYLATNYRPALANIRWLCENVGNSILHVDKYPNVANMLISMQTNLQPISIERNYARRFFENRVCTLYLGLELNTESINRIQYHFSQKAFDPRYIRQQAIASLHEDMYALTFSERGDYFLNSSIDFSHKRGRLTRPSFFDKDQEGSEMIKGESTMSRNTGIMKSSQPNFFDELSRVLLRNQITDTYIHEKSVAYKNKLVPSYPADNINSPFVSSISGHAFYTAALLEEYMAKNHASPTLNDDVNNYIHAYVATYVSSGFHSIKEVNDVFETPLVVEAFHQHGVEYDPSFSDAILEEAFKDTQRYTIQLLLKRSLENELTLPKPRV